MSTADTAKVFMSGRSQAVRLPKEYRFDGSEVFIRRVGNSVILTPKEQDWAAQVRAAFAQPGVEHEPLERPEEWTQVERDQLWP